MSRLSLRLLVLVGGVSMLQAASEARQADVRFDQISIAQGLPGATVTSIAQDAQGYMWFGTDAGLVRYDGYDMRVYLHDPRDSTSTGSDWVETLLVDRSGRVWIGTNGGGLNRYEPGTDSFTRFEYDPDDPSSLYSPPASSWAGLRNGQITALYEDRSGTLWIGTNSTGGLNRMDPETGTFTHYTEQDGLSHNAVRVILEDRGGALWIGTGDPFEYPPEPGRGGLNRFDPQRGTFRQYHHDPTDEYSLIDNHVSALYEDGEGVLWVGTWGDGLHRYDRERDRFVRFRHQPAGKDALSRPVLSQANGSPEQGGLRFIREDRFGQFWIGAFQGGINRYDRAAGRMWHYESNAGNPDGLRSNLVWTFHESRDGTLWVGALFDGVFRILPRLFRHYSDAPESAVRLVDPRVRAIHEDREGLIWLGTEGGLDAWDRVQNQITHYLHDPGNPASLSHNAIASLLEDRDGRLWIGTNGGGLNRLEGRSFVRYRYSSENPSSLGSDRVLRLFEDRRGRLWVGTGGGGISRWNPVEDTFTRFLLVERGPGGEEPPFFGEANTVQVIEESEDGSILAASSWMTYILEAGSDRFVELKGVRGGALVQADLGAAGRWIGTDGGIFLDHPGSVETERFTTGNGLPGNQIKAILPDDLGHVWISTNNGLSRIDPVERRVVNFGVEGGLQASVFYRQSALKSRNGELMFGGPGGLTVFDPADIEANALPPEIVLTRLRVSGGSDTEPLDVVLPVSASQGVEVELTHDQNDLTFFYTGLHYQDSSRNRYRYRLEPHENAWLEVGVQRQAQYMNLSPGRYLFRVTAAGANGVWNEEGVSLRFRILPPWWRTWWAYGIYLLLLVAGARAGYRRQRARIVRAERERARERELEQAREIERAYYQLEETHGALKTTQAQLIQQEKMASLGQLTAGIAHEIQNPLNFVNNFAQLNAELASELGEEVGTLRSKSIQEIEQVLDEFVSGLESNAQQIAKHGRRAEAIVRAMMEHAVAGKGERHEVNLNAFLEEYVDIAYNGLRARIPDLDVEIEKVLDPTVGPVWMSPRDVGRAVVNIANNALEAVYERFRSGGGDSAHKGLFADGGGAAGPLPQGDRREAPPAQGEWSASHAAEAESVYVPRVRVASRKLEGKVEIRISDNGMGIPHTIRDKIFEPFFTTKTTGTGPGLGLSLAYDIIVDGHQGSLTVEGEEGQGATFVISLPVRGRREA